MVQNALTPLFDVGKCGTSDTRAVGSGALGKASRSSDLRDALPQLSVHRLDYRFFAYRRFVIHTNIVLLDRSCWKLSMVS